MQCCGAQPIHAPHSLTRTYDTCLRTRVMSPCGGIQGTLPPPRIFRPLLSASTLKLHTIPPHHTDLASTSLSIPSNTNLGELQATPYSVAVNTPSNANLELPPSKRKPSEGESIINTKPIVANSSPSSKTNHDGLYGLGLRPELGLLLGFAESKVLEPLCHSPPRITKTKNNAQGACLQPYRNPWGYSLDANTVWGYNKVFRRALKLAYSVPCPTRGEVEAILVLP